MRKNKYEILDFIKSRTTFDSKKTSEVTKFIQDFLKSNTDALMSDGFTKRIVFGHTKNQEMLNIYKVDEKEWTTFANDHDVLKWSRNVSNLGNVLLMIHYIESGDYRILKFLSIKLFTSRYFKSFPKFMDESKMRATLAKLSKKFFIKKFGSLDKSLDATIKTYLNTYHDRFKNPTDDNIIYLINAIATRVDMFVNHIAEKYYANIERVYDDKEILDRDSMRSTTNNSLIFDGVISSAINRDMMSGVDKRLLHQLKLDKFVDDFTKINKMRKQTDILIKSIINDYISAYPDADIKMAISNIAKFTIQGRRNSTTTKSTINSIVSNISNENTTGIYKKEIYDAILLYYTMIIYTQMIRM